MKAVARATAVRTLRTAGEAVRILALLLVMACRETPAPDGPLTNVVAGILATTRDTSVESAKEWTFILRGETYRLDPDGRFTCGARGSSRLDLQDMPYVEKLQYVPYGDDVLILLYEQSDGEGGLSKIGRLHLPVCELVYTADIPGFNLGLATRHESKLYVSATGFVGQFDIEAWGYDWTHGNLYDRHLLNAFEVPVVYRDRVVFPESRGDSKPPRSVIVQKASGAITLRQ